MKTTRSPSKIVLFMLTVCVLAFARLGYALDVDITKYPSQPITLICPVPAGAGADLSLRVLSKEAEKFLGQPVIVVNKPGGGLVIGASAIASAKPDGYTIGHTATTPLLITPFLEKVPYDPLKDFQEIMQFGEVNLGVIVKGNSPFKKFQDLIDYGRQNPKKVTYGTQGATSISRLIIEQIARKEGVEFTHIPFKGSPETEAALLGGHIFFSAAGFNTPLLEAGETRLLLLLSDERRSEYPQVPILRDLGYFFPAPMFLNIAGPKGLPKSITQKLGNAFALATKEPAFIKGMKDLAYPIVYRNGQDLTEYVARSHASFAKLLKELGLAK